MVEGEFGEGIGGYFCRRRKAPEVTIPETECDESREN